MYLYIFLQHRCRLLINKYCRIYLQNTVAESTCKNYNIFYTTCLPTLVKYISMLNGLKKIIFFCTIIYRLLFPGVMIIYWWISQCSKATNLWIVCDQGCIKRTPVYWQYKNNHDVDMFLQISWLKKGILYYCEWFMYKTQLWNAIEIQNTTGESKQIWARLIHPLLPYWCL